MARIILAFPDATLITAATNSFLADACGYSVITKRGFAIRAALFGRTSVDLLPFTRLYSAAELADIVEEMSTTPSAFYVTDMTTAIETTEKCSEFHHLVTPKSDDTDSRHPRDKARQHTNTHAKHKVSV